MTVTYIINLPKYILKHFYPSSPYVSINISWYAKYAKMLYEMVKQI